MLLARIICFACKSKRLVELLFCFFQLDFGLSLNLTTKQFKCVLFESTNSILSLNCRYYNSLFCQFANLIRFICSVSRTYSSQMETAKKDFNSQTTHSVFVWEKYSCHSISTYHRSNLIHMLLTHMCYTFHMEPTEPSQ